MPAPDVQYYLSSAMEGGHIAGDTYHYFMEIAPNSAEILDSYESDADCTVGHWQRLMNLGLHMEHHFLLWRAGASSDDKRAASFMGLRAVKHSVREMLASASDIVVESGNVALTPKARGVLNKHLCFDQIVAVTGRSVNRAAVDLAGVPHGEMTRIWVDIERARISSWRDTQLAARGIVTGTEHDKDLARTRHNLRVRAKRDRRVIKRSIGFLNRLIGGETTRMFVGGQSIRFEGRLAVYEFTRKTSLMRNHGGLDALSVYDKDHPEVHLCDICIGTEGSIPLLDHIASLVMHIQSGNEEEILRIGNPGRVTEAGKSKEWLAEYLPTKWTPEELAMIMGPRAVMSWAIDVPVPKNEKAKKETIRKAINRVVYRDVFADHSELLQAVQRTNTPEIFSMIEGITRAAQQEVFVRLPLLTSDDHAWHD